MIVKTPGSQMGSPAAAEEGGEEMGGEKCESGERSEPTDGAPTDCMELNHQNQGGPKNQCGHYPGKRRVRGRDGVV